MKVLKRVHSPVREVQQMLGLVLAADPLLNDVVFVCIDCEAFESAQDKVTEIGVAILDMRDVASLAPTPDGKAWLEKIKYAHYRPVEYANFVNRMFVKGREQYFNFGNTTWINLKDSKKVLRRIFNDPARLAEAADFSVEIQDQKRNVVFVAHGAANDDAFLRRLGFSVSTVANRVRTVDTQVVAGGGKKNSIALHRLLLALGLEPHNLHNGGNDAAYTMQALVLMAIQEHVTPGSVAVGLTRLTPKGKLPPAARIDQLAPEIYAGTATSIPEVNAESAKLSRKQAKALFYGGKKTKTPIPTQRKSTEEPQGKAATNITHQEAKLLQQQPPTPGSDAAAPC